MRAGAAHAANCPRMASLTIERDMLPSEAMATRRAAPRLHRARAVEPMCAVAVGVVKPQITSLQPGDLRETQRREIVTSPPAPRR